jgi:hypothetical protein
LFPGEVAVTQWKLNEFKVRTDILSPRADILGIIALRIALCYQA